MEMTESRKPVVLVGGSPAASDGGSKGWQLTDTIVVASVPAIGYACEYAYERGFADAFQIPRQLITLRIESIFNLVPMLAMWLYAALAIVYWFGRGSAIHPLVSRMYRLVVMTAIFGALSVQIAPGGVGKASLWILTITWGLGAIVLLILPLVQAKLNRVKLADHLREDGPDGDEATHPFAHVRALAGRKVATLAVAMLLFGTGCYVYGVAEAHQHRFYPVLAGPPEQAVLRIYGDNVVSAKLDRNNHSVSPEFTVTKLGTDPKASLKVEAVGPLKLK